MAEIDLVDRPEVQEKLRRRIDSCSVKVGLPSRRLPAMPCLRHLAGGGVSPWHPCLLRRLIQPASPVGALPCLAAPRRC